MAELLILVHFCPTMRHRTATNRLGKVPIRWREDRARWELSIFAGGKRVRSLHETEEEAVAEWKKHCRKVERLGTQGDAISKAEGLEFLEAKRITGGADLREVAIFWRKHHPEGSEDVLAEVAWRQFLEEKTSQGLSKRHLQTLRHHVARFVSVYGESPLRELTGEVVREYLLSLKVEARTVANVRGSLSNWFSWCRRRRFLEVVPTDSIHDADLPAVRPKARGVLTVEQAAAMMRCIEERFPRFVPWHALQLFGGIRRAEVERIRWEWIDLERQTITLPGWESGERVVKTGDDWVLHGLPENLFAWLAPHHGTGRVPAPSPELIAEWRGTVFPTLEPAIAPWPANAMRHTFATMLLSLHQDASRVAVWMRHSSPAQLYRSYVARLVPVEEARRFTGIRPQTPP